MTQGPSSHHSAAQLQQQQQQQGQMSTRHSGGQVLLPNGQQGVSSQQLQGQMLGQLQPGHRDPAMTKLAHLHSQLRNQMDPRSYGLVQEGQAYSNQMQPPGSFHMAAGNNLQAHGGNSTPTHSGLDPQMNPQAVTQLQGQASPQVHSGSGVSGGNQIQLQLNHAQALSQLQGQSTMSQVSAPGLSGGGHTSPLFNQLSQQTFQSLSKQLTPQPSGQVHSQSHSLNQTVANGGQQSLPGTPQSEISDLRSNV